MQICHHPRGVVYVNLHELSIIKTYAVFREEFGARSPIHIRMKQGAEAFGPRVKRLRLERKWSQEELAVRTGARIDQTMISRIENRVKYEPGVLVVLALARALGTTVEYLMLGDGGATPPGPPPAELGRRSPEDERRLVAFGGKALAKAVRDLRHRVEVLERRLATTEPQRKRARR